MTTSHIYDYEGIRSLQWSAKDFIPEYNGTRGQKEQCHNQREVTQELRDTSTVRLKCTYTKPTSCVNSGLKTDSPGTKPPKKKSVMQDFSFCI